METSAIALLYLPDYRLFSGTKHYDILKVLMLHCQSFSFDFVYEHVEAHHDDHDAHMKLSQVAQLNYCMDIDAKRELWELVGQMTLPLDLLW